MGQLLLPVSADTGTIWTEEIPWICTKLPWAAQTQEALARNIPCRKP